MQPIRFLKLAATDGGKITALPASCLGQIVTPFQVSTVTFLAVPIAYLAEVASNGMERSEWYTHTGF